MKNNFYIIGNNKRTRWLIELPVLNLKILKILKNWSPGSLKNRIFWTFFLIDLYYFKAFFSRLLFKRLSLESTFINVKLERYSAYYVGTKTPHQKLIQFYSQNDKIYINKIPIGNKSYDSIQNEIRNLKKISDYSKIAKYRDGHLEYIFQDHSTLEEDDVKKILSNLQTIPCKRNVNEVRKLFSTSLIHKNLNVKDKEKLLTIFENNSAIYNPTCEHGDFAPWNILKNRSQLFLIDWEFSQFGVPRGYDRFRYSIITNRKTNYIQALKAVALDIYDEDKDAKNFCLIYCLLMELKNLSERQEEINKNTLKEIFDLLKLMLKSNYLDYLV